MDASNARRVTMENVNITEIMMLIKDAAAKGLTSINRKTLDSGELCKLRFLTFNCNTCAQGGWTIDWSNA